MHDLSVDLEVNCMNYASVLYMSPGTKKAQVLEKKISPIFQIQNGKSFLRPIKQML